VAELDGLIVLVTGATSGIGRAIAMGAAAAGADVVLTYAKKRNDARDTAHDITASGRRATVFPLDLADTGGVDAALDSLAAGARAAFGRIDVWINNAGADILTGDGAKLSTVAKLDRLLAVDLRGTMIASWHAASMMCEQQQGGVIINMSWDHVLTGLEGTNPQLFAAVKGGVLAFSKALARSVAPKVRVNILAPGWIETAFAAELDPERHKAIAAATPLGRWGTPEDVARAAVYLASPAAGFLTGQTIFVNGGAVMG
jgi:3-oxoacyl-[acyl-carrier protein] reductase